MRHLKVVGPQGGRLDVTREMRIVAYKKAKVYCAEAVELSPKDVVALGQVRKRII
jgi:hypothetical protein